MFGSVSRGNPSAMSATSVPLGSAPRPRTPEPWLFPASALPARRRRDDLTLPDAVLFDRDGTLVVDVPYNGDPGWVRPMPGASQALAELRALRIPLGVVSNQSGVARGVLTRRQVAAVQSRIEQLLGPFRVWAVCPHGPDDGCRCRKPAPGLVLAACRRLGARPARTVVIGDIGSDVAAAEAAGARGILVPAPTTREEEVDGAHEAAPDLLAAVRMALHRTARSGPAGQPPPPGPGRPCGSGGGPR